MKQNSTLIMVDLDSISQSLSGQITGKIVFQLNDDYFPDDNWNDFVVVILGWWIDEVRKINQADKQLCFNFMDGPFKFLLDRHDSDDLFDVTWVDERNSEKRTTKIVGTLTGADLLDNLLEAANKVIRKCKENQYESTDLISLEKSYNDLRYGVNIH